MAVPGKSKGKEDMIKAPFPYFGGKSTVMVANFWRAVSYDAHAVAHYADWPPNEAVTTATGFVK